MSSEINVQNCNIKIVVNNYNTSKNQNLRVLQLICEIPLTNSEIKELVDAKNYDKMSNFKWTLTKKGYVLSTTLVVDDFDTEFGKSI